MENRNLLNIELSNLGTIDSIDSLITDAVERFESEEQKESFVQSKNDYKDELHRRMMYYLDKHIKLRQNDRQIKLDLIRRLNIERESGYYNALWDVDTWNGAGYCWDTLTDDNTNHSIDALDIIQSLPLRTYKLRNDTKKDLLVNRGVASEEMRTRYHIGVILGQPLHGNANEEYFDPALFNGRLANNGSSNIDKEAMDTHNNDHFNNLISYYNIRALQILAQKLEDMEAKVDVLRYFTTNRDILTSENSAGNAGDVFQNLQMRINNVREKMQNSDANLNRHNGSEQVEFESFGKLIARMTALEAEASSANATYLGKSIHHSTRLQTLSQTLQKQLSQMNHQANSVAFLQEFENEFRRWNDNEIAHSEFLLDGVIENIRMMYKVSSIGNDTAR